MKDGRCHIDSLNLQVCWVLYEYLGVLPPGSGEYIVHANYNRSLARRSGGDSRGSAYFRVMNKLSPTSLSGKSIDHDVHGGTCLSGSAERAQLPRRRPH